MSNLKELTWEHHKNAERQEFVKVLMSGKINSKFYATYLWNQKQKYEALERALDSFKTWQNDELLFDIRRTEPITSDWLELWDVKKGMPITVASTFAYLDRISEIKKDKQKLLAHVYVLHMGDLSGGQMIKKRVPGEGRMYQFKGDQTALKENLRSYTNDDMAEEAKWVFDSATQLFKELMEVDGVEHYME